MKLTNQKEVQDFIQVVNACRRDVHLVTPKGKILNLKDGASLYVGIGCLLREDGDCMELFADCREDEYRLIGFLNALTQDRWTPPYLAAS